MASYYALTARMTGEKEKTCALIPSASIASAEKAAREMRKSGALGFVEPGSRFRLRGASRTETSLLRRFLHSCSLESPADRIGSDFDGLLVRRQRLILSFFIGLYHDPVGMRKRLRDVPDPGHPSPKPGSGTGGVEMAPAEKEETPEIPEPAGELPSVQEAPEAAAEGIAHPDSQEAALADILSSPEANDGGAGRDDAMDLDDLF